MLAVEDVEAAALVTTTTDCPALLVTLSIVSDVPAVQPTNPYKMLVEEPVIAELAIVNVSAPPAVTVGEVKVTAPARPLQGTVPDAAPDAVVTGREIP